MSEDLQVSAPIITRGQRPRGFISSTLGELKPERMAVKKTVKSLNLHPVMFEEGARPYPPRAVYRSYVEQSHIYVGIFSESYGWVAPDMDISGIEDEYNLSSNIRRLVYIKQTTHARDPPLEE